MTTRRQEDDSLAEADLRVNLGTTESGDPVVLDLRERGDGGDGPHGVVLGRCGAGKTVLLKSVVGQLADRNDAEELSVKVFDPVGSFGRWDDPVVEVYSPQAGGFSPDREKQANVARFVADVRDELQLRQSRLVKAYSNRASDAGPTLVLVVDDVDSDGLGEAGHREVEELFELVGRLGRALGVHLVVARHNETRFWPLPQYYSYGIVFDSNSFTYRRLVGDEGAHMLPRGHALLWSANREEGPVVFSSIGPEK